MIVHKKDGDLYRPPIASHIDTEGVRREEGREVGGVWFFLETLRRRA
ncbi:MAG: hypothetical protein JMM79_01045 [Candidatus Xiphinematobacter sp.]|nr:MAG: hypothetical protein JMM79_01045 [Candidatus Xiphinematobacter sp.]